MADRRREDDEDDRPRRRGRDDDEDRGSRRSSRDDDDRTSRRSRDDDDRGSSRRGREDDDDDRRSSRRGRDDDDDDRGGSSSYRYERRDSEKTRERANKGNNDFDKFLKDHIKAFKVNDGDNRIRIIPPTWKKADHHGLDIYVHYAVGADRQSYLCPKKMKDEPCPVCEARDELKRELNDNEGDKDLEKQVKALEPKRRVLAYLIDRDHEKEGPQAWAMPWTVDRDTVQVMTDKSTGEVLPIDDPKEGYDVEFTKKGAKDRTEYTGVAIARRSSPLGKSAWLEFAIDNPLPDQLVYFPYEHIAKAFGGKSTSRREDDDDDRRDSRRSREDDEPKRGRDRDEEERGGGRDRDDDRGSRSRSRDDSAPTWESIHDMTKSELEDLIEEKDLDIKPKDAKDVDDLRDWVCEEMGIKKPKQEERGSRRGSDDDGDDDRLRRMRERRERD
jgi:hypothetical protein